MLFAGAPSLTRPTIPTPFEVLPLLFGLQISMALPIPVLASQITTIQLCPGFTSFFDSPSPLDSLEGHRGTSHTTPAVSVALYHSDTI
jgi:hypothetical protein